LNPIYSLRVLLTPTERRRPWILYLTPGLLATQVAHIAYIVLGLRSIRQLLLPELANPGIPRSEEISPVKLVIFFVIALLSTIILTPLEVIAIRLSIQRNHAAPEFNSISQEEEGDADEATEYAGVEEDVIGYVKLRFSFLLPEITNHVCSLRTEREPYVGLIDCGKRIIEEEGWGALYRAWWLTTLGSISGAFS
jgi:hypothetical protein